MQMTEQTLIVKTCHLTFLACACILYCDANITVTTWTPFSALSCSVLKYLLSRCMKLHVRPRMHQRPRLRVVRLGSAGRARRSQGATVTVSYLTVKWDRMRLHGNQALGLKVGIFAWHEQQHNDWLSDWINPSFYLMILSGWQTFDQNQSDQNIQIWPATRY